MKSVLLDTNVLLSFLSDRDLDQQEKAAHLFAAAANREMRIDLHQIVVTEAVYVLTNSYEQSADAVSDVIGSLLALPGVVSVDLAPWRRVLGAWPRPFRDFADAMLAAFAKETRVDAVATFDRRFASSLKRQGIESVW